MGGGKNDVLSRLLRTVGVSRPRNYNLGALDCSA